ncbi:pyruvate kinase [Clostridium sp. SM-530-WT-3G]|uniref:pyruvate kinase n=1 Tax=Clostridium sp. SM-530-WT-3G TaxID=2725303 RepID=UPI00145F7B56|nr:pyruvate kinase [Clostridium sp. SM-530-WT-3G]NME82720.1 pyruvate kinase [Clostridium sp. SM-530-WT-3G]
MYIIGTVGPSVKDRNSFKGIIDNGVNTVRFNFAHGSEAEFIEFLNMARTIDDSLNVLVDLSGRKVRVSDKFEYIYKIYNDEDVYFCGEDKYTKEIKNLPKNKVKVIPLNIKHKMLEENVYKEISIKDNTMRFKIIENNNENLIKTKAVKGGIIRKGKGCNIKELDRSFLSLNVNDKRAIQWGIKNKVDIICQSFVEDKEDVEELKKFLDENKNGDNVPKVWAKIETLKGVKNLERILSCVDGIVIGRGDLIPETSIEDTPIYQEKIIQAVTKFTNKDLIVATHLLNSMKLGKVPSLCEVESIYNLIKEGVTGFLLAGETSVGKAPIKTVKFLNELIVRYMSL